MLPYITVFGRTISSYGLMMTLGILLAGFLACRRAKKLDVKFEDVLIVAAFAIGIGLFGAKLLYIFVTYPIPELIASIQAGNFDFLGGGIVFYGGLIGGVLGALLGVKVAKCSFGSIEAVVVPYIPLGHGIGRIGCLLAGCCHGMEYTGPLAVYYPNSISGLHPEQGYFPVQPLEALLNVGIFLLLRQFAKGERKSGDLLFAYLGCYSIVRFGLEFLRGDSIRGIYWNVSLSQWISMGLLLCSIAWLLWRKLQKAK